jgi:hypothetical protein
MYLHIKSTVAGKVEAIPGTKMYIAVVSSAQELPDLEKLHLLDPSIPIVLFNLRLDILVSTSPLKQDIFTAALLKCEPETLCVFNSAFGAFSLTLYFTYPH